MCQGLTCIPAIFRQSEGEQEQTSHELQLLGATAVLDWIAGLYHFDESAEQILRNATPPEPETVDSIEVCFKGNLFDDRLQLNVALYSAQYEDLVVGDLGTGKADVRGLEIESTWLTSNHLYHSVRR